MIVWSSLSLTLLIFLGKNFFISGDNYVYTKWCILESNIVNFVKFKNSCILYM